MAVPLQSHIEPADVAELADAPDLGSGGRPCRFDSCHPHKMDKSSDLSIFIFANPIIILLKILLFSNNFQKNGDYYGKYSAIPS